jgi:TolB protein
MSKIALNYLAIFITMAIAIQSCSPKTKPVARVIMAPGTTGNAESLTRETSEPSDEFYPRISADGRYLFYNVVESTSTGGGVRRGVTFTDILLGNSIFDPVVKTNNKTKIVRKEIGKPTTNPLKDNAADASQMPDGNILFTYVLPSKPVIAWTSSDGVGINYVSQGELGDDDSQPVVSRDGNKIVFTTLIGGTRMICSMDKKGGNFTVITEGYKPIFHPTDINKIVYNLAIEKHVQIFTLDLKSGQKSQLSSGEYNNKDASFSFDGQYVAFVSNRENPKLPRHHVYIMRADGTDIKQITQGETDEADPTWGPDGMLYFSCDAAKNYSIWKARPRIAVGTVTTR